MPFLTADIWGAAEEKGEEQFLPTELLQVEEALNWFTHEWGEMALLTWRYLMHTLHLPAGLH